MSAPAAATGSRHAFIICRTASVSRPSPQMRYGAPGLASSSLWLMISPRMPAMRLALIVALVAVVVRNGAAQAPGPDTYLRRLAVELGAERDASPILLGPDRDKPLAVAYDR